MLICVGIVVVPGAGLRVVWVGVSDTSADCICGEAEVGGALVGAG